MKPGMRQACPSCGSIYELPAEILARLPASLRCARCGTTWEAAAPPPDDATSLDLPKPPATATPIAAAEPKPGSRTAMTTPLDLAPAGASAAVDAATAGAPPPGAAFRRHRVVSILALAVAIILILALHKPIGQAWPPMLRLYRAIGLG